MARPLLTNLPLHKLLPAAPFITFLIALAAIFSIFSAVIFLCGSHTILQKSLTRDKKKLTVRLGGGGDTNNHKHTVFKKMQSSLSSKALLMSKMISWRKVQDHNDVVLGPEEIEFEREEDGVVWKKTIIKGEKCRPLDFSGKILYDADGNLLPDS